MSTELLKRALTLEESNPLGAAKLYKEILAINPNHVCANINLGRIYHDRSDFQSARDQYQKALAIDPNHVVAHFNLANAYDDLGDLPSAIAEYQAAIRIAPNYPDPHYNLALAYEMSGAPRKALIHWQRYLKLDLASSWHRSAREKIKRILRADPLKIVWRNPNPTIARTSTRAILEVA